MLQGGDFALGNGAGGESIFGKKFKDERAGLALKHDKRGVLSMGNSGKNSNSSQFFLTFDKAPQCDGKHVIFGQIKSGMQVLDACERLGTSSGAPAVPIVITDCGIYQPLQTPGSGFWYDQPDPDSYSGVSPVFIVRPRVVLLAPSTAVLQKFASALGKNASIVDQLEMKEDGEAQVSRINELLADFSADIAVVAPACKSVKSSFQVPKSWQASSGTTNSISLEEIILVTKPVDALSAVHSKSWLSKQSQWRLDGNC